MLNWLVAQKDKAKFAWTVVLLISSMFGYNISVTKTEKADIQKLEQKVDTVKTAIDTVNKVLQELKK